jgi:hypothetical protein
VQHETEFLQAVDPNDDAPLVDFLSILVVTVSLSGLGIIALISLAKTLGLLV